jgi:hypothetical protein
MTGKTSYEKFLDDRKLYCRKCGKLMAELQLGGDMFSMFNIANYCKNKKCDDFGYVVVAGIKK